MTTLLRVESVAALVDLGVSTISQLVREGKFPQPIHLDEPKVSRWVSTDIEDWIEEQIEKDRGQAPRPSDSGTP